MRKSNGCPNNDADASFEDGRDAPLNLGALDVDDLNVLSRLVQDRVFPITEMKWDRKAAPLWSVAEPVPLGRGGRVKSSPERVQSVLAFDGVLNVASQGVDRADPDMVLSLLTVEFEAGEDGAGDMILTLAGDGAIRRQGRERSKPRSRTSRARTLHLQNAHRRIQSSRSQNI